MKFNLHILASLTINRIISWMNETIFFFSLPEKIKIRIQKKKKRKQSRSKWRAKLGSKKRTKTQDREMQKRKTISTIIELGGRKKKERNYASSSYEWPRFKTIFVSWPRSDEDGTTTRFSQRGVKIKKEKKSHHARKVCVHRGKDPRAPCISSEKSISYLEPSLLEMNPSLPLPLPSFSCS